MADNRTKKQRSKNMSKIRSKNTKTELKMKKFLQGTYLRYQPEIYGRPDFGSKKFRIAVFIDGCFWHKCPKCYSVPKSNRKFWVNKINTNAKRDKKINHALKKQNYLTLRFWEHQIDKDATSCLNRITKEVRRRKWEN